ncbi:MAG: cytochrome c3 family protein [Planctomycetota bacterium]
MGFLSIARPHRARRACLAAAAAGVVAAPAPAPSAAPSPLPQGITAVPGHLNRGWVGGDCGGCHAIREPWTHPVGVVPSMPVPPEFPLQDGLLVCTTCHDNRSSTDHARARRLHEPLLRESGPDGLCAGCHDPNGTGRRDMHATMLGRAHLAWPDSVGQELPGGDEPPASPDAASRTCLECHDGSVAPGAADASVPDGSARSHPPVHAPIGASHPIGVAYGLTPGLALKAADELDPRIRLFEGRVGCGSCHSPFAGGKALLVMSNLDSRLCLSCHTY